MNADIPDDVPQRTPVQPYINVATLVIVTAIIYLLVMAAFLLL